MTSSKSSEMTIFALLTLGVLISSLVGFSGCLDLDDDTDDRIRVIVSILPQKEFAERVGGEYVKVTVMVGEGQDPHGYEPRPSQLIDVAKADVYFIVGSGVEFENIWLDTLIEQNGDMEIVDASKGIELIASAEEDHDEDHDSDQNESHDDEHEENGNQTHEDDSGEHDHEGDDPHIWNSPVNAMIMVGNLRDALVRIDPEHASDYSNNSQEYLSELDAVDRDMRSGLESHGGKKFLVYHPSFGYLAHQYNLSQIAIEDEGKEPTPAGVQAIIDQAKAENITTIFVSPQFDESNAQTIAKEIGGTVVRIDPLGEHYLENMRKVREKLIDGFES